MLPILTPYQLEHLQRMGYEVFDDSGMIILYRHCGRRRLKEVELFQVVEVYRYIGRPGRTAVGLELSIDRQTLKPQVRAVVDREKIEPIRPEHRPGWHIGVKRGKSLWEDICCGKVEAVSKAVDMLMRVAEEMREGR